MRMKYLSTFEAAEKWGISHRRVNVLCNEGRITGAQRAGSRWKVQRSPPMPESEAENISKSRQRKGGHNQWKTPFYPVLSGSALPI